MRWERTISRAIPTATFAIGQDDAHSTQIEEVRDNRRRGGGSAVKALRVIQAEFHNATEASNVLAEGPSFVRVAPYRRSEIDVENHRHVAIVGDRDRLQDGA